MIFWLIFQEVTTQRSISQVYSGHLTNQNAKFWEKEGNKAPELQQSKDNSKVICKVVNHENLHCLISFGVFSFAPFILCRLFSSHLQQKVNKWLHEDLNKFHFWQDETLDSELYENSEESLREKLDDSESEEEDSSEEREREILAGFGSSETKASKFENDLEENGWTSSQSSSSTDVGSENYGDYLALHLTCWRLEKVILSVLYSPITY